jgi:hypothetical protein
MHQLHQTTLIDGESDLWLHLLVLPSTRAPSGHPRDAAEPLLRQLALENVARVPPFFLPSVVTSLLLPSWGRERLAELWFAAGALVDPEIPAAVRRFAEAVTTIEVATLGQSLAGAAAVAATVGGAVFAGFLHGGAMPLGVLSLPDTLAVCTGGGAERRAGEVQAQLEAWLRSPA